MVSLRYFAPSHRYPSGIKWNYLQVIRNNHLFAIATETFEPGFQNQRYFLLSSIFEKNRVSLR